MSSLIQKINTLDFSVYIGEPLKAVVQEQHTPSNSQLSFIKEVGIDNCDNLHYADFEFEKSVANADSTCVDFKPVAFRKLASNIFSIKKLF